jgi:hypothetical protein
LLTPLPFVVSVPGVVRGPLALGHADPVMLAAQVTRGGNKAAYDVFIGLHVAAVLVGFGAVAMNGAYGGNARKAGVDGPVGDTAMEELRRYFGPPGRAELVICVVPFLGVAALAVKPGPSDFGQIWVGTGVALWVVATVLLFGVVRPAESVLRRAARAPIEEASEGEADSGQVPLEPSSAPAAPRPGRDVLAAAGRRLQWAAAASDLIFLVALVVMVIQPGS